MSEEELPPEESTANQLKSEQCDALIEALDTLYIPENMSGRIHFMNEWPLVAHYIFGEELIQHDTDGSPDRVRRDELEQEARQRRLDFLEVLSTFEENSVKKGVLQAEYVNDLVNKLGREFALLIYSPRFVDPVIPPAPGEEVVTPEVEQSAELAAPVEEPAPADVNPASTEPVPIEPAVEPIAIEPSPQEEQPATPPEPTPMPSIPPPAVPIPPLPPEPQSAPQVVEPDVQPIETAPIDPPPAPPVEQTEAAAPQNPDGPIKFDSLVDDQKE